MDIYILIGIHITINSIAMKMGEDMYSTILYSWKIYKVYHVNSYWEK